MIRVNMVVGAMRCSPVPGFGEGALVLAVDALHIARRGKGRSPDPALPFLQSKN